MLDELALRRQEFQADSNPVVLADGQTWWLAKPTVSLKLRFVGGRSTGFQSRTNFGAEFDQLVSAVTSADPGTDELYLAASNVAADLLARNYSLTDDDLGSLFDFPDDSIGFMDTLKIAMNTARGLDAPKPSTGG